ncbi:hypothetical protein [Legionella jordanis]|uniref:Integral membrane protein (PIN domain superfamily) n=1 Tax=Legionella jordanis TaxID=456 RepID=A0A0W0VBT7_9GAMM|nr:hypothetical protein [Legionella jordanis]KTD17604.1 Integral membrane protein (PIN domain superfamily) [Legionella jordanis]RMX00887.1 hypothetical protein EAW55_11975 [Legionella jordanis]VEH11474.1 Integral membrane protein (PIN domain superfamily) [Legionella jordanis]
MELTLFLGKVIGWYFVIVALWIVIRQELANAIISETIAHRALLFFMAIITLILGLMIVISHNVWVMGWPVIITIVGWLMLIGGLLRLFFPEIGVRIAQAWLRKPVYFWIAAAIYLIIGLYLLYRAYFR